jgi:pimeloyl-ACP methyl ester carboxylesterase
MPYQETVVRRDQHRIHVRDYPGAGPPIILMHGFPDNSHLYDRLVPYLSPPRRVVLFDFLGWGNSDKPSGYPYTTANQVGDLDAVITQLGLEQVLLVAHDASGPPAIDWALAQPERVSGLVLLNTYYCEMPTLRPPEVIWLFATPGLVASLNRPGGNITGVTYLSSTWGAKRLELLRQLVPKATLIAMLVNPGRHDTEPERKDVQAAARAIGLQLITLDVSNDRDSTFQKKFSNAWRHRTRRRSSLSASLTAKCE